MRILLVGDNPDSARVMVAQLVQMGNGYTVDTASWSLYASTLLNGTDLVLVNDYNCTDCEKLARLRQRTICPIFLVSAIEDDETLAQLYTSGIDDHLVQPVSYPLLSAKIRVWQRWVTRPVIELLFS